ncbi:hypothetical protein C5Y96_12115 [Blastopirellula marina]|uniref:Uncharacterized protein n=1 Tax=Blastopirellula marina TaxID=124 RepID=A0A2S8FG14_9BACT|nr:MULTISPECIES: hypothetical protein [Pirellulaceae]PQO31096.1 hypothetical protein C5Y96_12115 [Blastopirellula marina]RCS51490.1 hypothetical protein DTL36_12125 [Bremerella cremea]
MRRQLGFGTRRGQIPTGTILMLVGAMDILMALGLWFFLGQGDMVFTLFFAFIGLSGLGMIGFGFMQNLK